MKAKKEELQDLQERLISAKKDAEFELESAEKRFKFESKMLRKEAKKLSKQLKQMERKMVSLKLQACDVIVEKDELEIRLSKQVKILRARVEEYERDIREWNLMSKTRDQRGFWDRLFK